MIHPKLAVLAAITLVMVAGCHRDEPDYGPIRDGLRSVGICLVAAAAVLALGAIINNNNNNRKGGGNDD